MEDRYPGQANQGEREAQEGKGCSGTNRESDPETPGGLPPLGPLKYTWWEPVAYSNKAWHFYTFFSSQWEVLWRSLSISHLFSLSTALRSVTFCLGCSQQHWLCYFPAPSQFSKCYTHYYFISTVVKVAGFLGLYYSFTDLSKALTRVLPFSCSWENPEL